MPEIVIAYFYNDANINFFTPFFEEVIPVRKIYIDYASKKGCAEQTVFICKKPRQDFNAMKKLFEKRIFE